MERGGERREEEERNDGEVALGFVALLEGEESDEDL